MKKIDLGQTITILANVGVIVGIIFLAAELRQNNRQLALQSYQALVGQINDLSKTSIEFPQATRNRYEPFQNLSPVEQTQVTNSMVMLIRLGDLAYYQYSLGMLDEQRLESAIGPIIAHWCSEAFTIVWSGLRDRAATGYKEFLDARLSESCALLAD